MLSPTDGGGVFYNDDTHDLITRNCIATGNWARSRGGFGQVILSLFILLSTKFCIPIHFFCCCYNFKF